MLLKEHSIVTILTDLQIVSGGRDMTNTQLTTLLFHTELQ